ncbi:hypothetical protein FRC12_008031 [Ceratobasidium sp. 428]|nr:hypothetical protein FRC12_008031 [Ceratobasidium sp. 428]
MSERPKAPANLPVPLEPVPLLPSLLSLLLPPLLLSPLSPDDVEFGLDWREDAESAVPEDGPDEEPGEEA